MGPKMAGIESCEGSPTMAAAVLGLDVGGAHLKWALLDGAGRIEAVGEEAMPLWQGLARLEAALATLPPSARTAPDVAVTMTGELVDLFPDRPSGVRRLLQALVAHFARARLAVYGGASGFLEPTAAHRQPHRVASANWRAVAELCARRLGDGMLVDLGSTTTDLVPFAGGRVRARGTSDHERLCARELVYLGLVRTPLCALGPDIPFRGTRVPLMNEWFATSADVFRLLGLLDEADDRHPAADGGPKTVAGSARRLARMVGCDLADAPLASWRQLASAFMARFLARLEEAARQVLAAVPLPPAAPLVTTGCGHRLAARLASRLGRPARGFAELVEAPDTLAHAVEVAAPAVAVARLFRAQVAGEG